MTHEYRSDNLKRKSRKTKKLRKANIFIINEKRGIEGKTNMIKKRRNNAITKRKEHDQIR